MLHGSPAMISSLFRVLLGLGRPGNLLLTSRGDLTYADSY